MPSPSYRSPSDSHMTLGQHLDELRLRLIYAILGLLPLVLAALYFGDDILDIILEPARQALQKGEQPEITSLAMFETFSSYMRVSIISAVVVGSPWVLFQVWRFVAPGLHKEERRFVYFLIPLSGILTASGVFFLFKVVLPLVLSFLITFGTSLGRKPIPTGPVPPGVLLPTLPLLEKDPEAPLPGQMWINTSVHKMRICIEVPTPAAATPPETSAPVGATPPPTDAPAKPASATTPAAAPTTHPVAAITEPVVLSVDLYREAGIRQQYRIGDVLSTMLTFILAFAGAFQAPLIVLLLGWAGIVDNKFLNKYRRHAVLVCAIVAAAVMPGDPASMMAMMIPLYLLYELGGLLLWLFPAHRVAGRPKPVSELTDGTTEDEDDRP